MNLPKNFTPMKPATLNRLEDLDLSKQYYIQPKLDGVRCLIVNGKLLSNTLKEFPNGAKLKAHFGQLCDIYHQSMLEGEIVAIGGTLQDVISVVMSENISVPRNIKIVLFDRVFESCLYAPYSARYSWLMETFHTQGILLENVRPIFNESVITLTKLEEVEAEFCKTYEGIILREKNSPYKLGRATEKEGYLFKFKRTEDAEATIIETLELMHNGNAKDIDERGYVKRSAAKANKRSTGLAGSLLVKGINGRFEGKVFKVSLGSCDRDIREWYWNTRKRNMGRIITYTYAKHRGTKDAPAEPRLKALREEMV